MEFSPLSLPFLAEINVFDFSWISTPEAWVSLMTLAALEIVLGIDNIVFISILVDKLPEEDRARGRFIGLSLAMVTRIMLLLSITWVMQLLSLIPMRRRRRNKRVESRAYAAQ